MEGTVASIHVDFNSVQFNKAALIKELQKYVHLMTDCMQEIMGC